jgi:tetratricopeptide (TPR) repeat protein
MKATFLLGSLHLLFATCSGAPAPSLEAEGQLKEAARLLAEDDPDGALAITDKLRKAYPNWAAAFVLAGDGNLKLSKIERRGLNAQAVLADAESNFLTATDIEPENASAWRGVAEARYQLADFDGARQAASKALELASKNGDANAVVTGQAALAGARACQQQFVTLRQAELKDGEPDARGIVKIEEKTAAKAQEALSLFAICQRTLPADGYRGAALVYQWLGANDEAVRELERGVVSMPENADLHIAFQDFHMQIGQQRALAGAYTRLVRENPSQPLMLWFQGRALVIVADDLRARQNLQPAIEQYRKAAQCYRDYAEKSPGHRDAAGQWVAICELSIARAAADMGDTVSAAERMFAAVDASPMTLAYDGMEPQLRDSFGSHFAGVVFAIGKTLTASVDEKALEQTIAFYDRVIERCPGMFGFVYNNAALPCRDLGVLRVRDVESMQPAQREKAMTDAMALWEKSYRYYEEAVKLSPDDARIVNDCGLMLIYHLNRGFDRARELFDRAIQVGEAQRAAMPADATKEDRQLLEEAVGDAWQNIAVLMSKHQNRPFEELKPFLEKAVQFYPYQQREAAHMLTNGGKGGDAPRLNPRSLQGLGTANASATQGQGGEKEKSDAAKAKAEAAAKDGDLDTALAELDKANRELKDYGPFQAIRGDYALRYARTALSEGRKGADMLFADAVAILKRAVELDSEPNQPRLWLAESQYEAGQLADAAKTAAALLLHMQSQGGGDQKIVTAAHTLRANAASRQFISNKDDAASKAMLEDARLSFRFLEQKKLLDAEARRTWATMEQWAEAGAGAVGVYARALADNKDDQTLLNAVVDTAYAVGEPSLAVDALKDRTDGSGLWYLGRARFLSASSMRAGGKLDEAMAELEQAKGAFEKSMKDNAAFADSCQQWIAICMGKQGNVALAKKDWVAAEKLLLDAVRARPDRINDDLGLQETTKIGVMVLADHYAQGGDLGKTESIYRAATAAAANDLDLLNNEGLFARDHGNALERAGKTKEAQELYEQSYKAYSRAAELDTTNVRLLNDRALIAIHYLERDWDENKTILDRAIELGEQQLKDFPAADPQGKKTLDEALGDAYENLALWHLKHSNDAAKAKAAAEQSMLHHPGKGRPGARRHLMEAEKALKGAK